MVVAAWLQRIPVVVRRIKQPPGKHLYNTLERCRVHARDG